MVAFLSHRGGVVLHVGDVRVEQSGEGEDDRVALDERYLVCGKEIATEEAETEEVMKKRNAP